MCTKMYERQFDPAQISLFNYTHYGKKGFVGYVPCDFCGEEMTVLFTEKRKLLAIDEKWENKHSEILSELAKVERRIYRLERRLEEHENNETLLAELEQLKTNMKTLEDALHKEENEYRSFIDG